MEQNELRNCDAQIFLSLFVYFSFFLNLTESFALEKFLTWNNAGEMFNVYIKLQYGLTQTGFTLVSQESTFPEKKSC